MVHYFGDDSELCVSCLFVLFLFLFLGFVLFLFCLFVCLFCFCFLFCFFAFFEKLQDADVTNLGLFKNPEILTSKSRDFDIRHFILRVFSRNYRSDCTFTRRAAYSSSKWLRPHNTNLAEDWCIKWWVVPVNNRGEHKIFPDFLRPAGDKHGYHLSNMNSLDPINIINSIRTRRHWNASSW